MIKNLGRIYKIRDRDFKLLTTFGCTVDATDPGMAESPPPWRAPRFPVALGAQERAFLAGYYWAVLAAECRFLWRVLVAEVLVLAPCGHSDQ